MRAAAGGGGRVVAAAAAAGRRVALATELTAVPIIRVPENVNSAAQASQRLERRPYLAGGHQR